MQYALVNSKKSLPSPKIRGTCELCEADALSKCGRKTVWHWAHKSGKKCDPWWENETPWHKAWKEEFPEPWREIIHICPETGERHRADVKTDKGIIVEVQNCPISLQEMNSREAFYKNLVWIINGNKFKERFYILHPLPDPLSDFDKDIVFESRKHNHAGKLFWRKSKNAPYLSGESNLVQIEGIDTIQDQIEKYYCGHHIYDWVKPHVAWQQSTCPLFIDFGDPILWGLQMYGNQHLSCIKGISRKKLLHDIVTESLAINIGTNFYPIR